MSCRNEQVHDDHLSAAVASEWNRDCESKNNVNISKSKELEKKREGNKTTDDGERTLKSLCACSHSSLQADGRVENNGFILAVGVHVDGDDRRGWRGAE